MQAEILRAKALIQSKERIFQSFSKNYDNFQANFFNQLKVLEENKDKCFQQSCQGKLIGKKQEKQQSSSSIDKSSKIKKPKKNAKKKALVKPIQQSKQHILVVVNRLMSKYTATIAKNSLVWTSKLKQKKHQRNIFVTVLKYLEGEYHKFEKEFEKQLINKKQQIDFGHFFQFQNPLPNEFCAMIFRSFPQLKKYIQNFDQSLLTLDDYKVLRANEDSIIPILLGYQYQDPDLQQDTCEIDFSLLQKQEDEKQDDEQTTSSQRKRGKNKKKKNKKKKSKKGKTKQLSDSSSVMRQRDIQNQFQIQKQSKAIDEARFEQICNLIQNIQINEDDRAPCNVTEQWASKYLKMNKNYKK